MEKISIYNKIAMLLDINVHDKHRVAKGEDCRPQSENIEENRKQVNYRSVDLPLFRIK